MRKQKIVYKIFNETVRSIKDICIKRAICDVSSTLWPKNEKLFFNKRELDNIFPAETGKVYWKKFQLFFLTLRDLIGKSG